MNLIFESLLSAHFSLLLETRNFVNIFQIKLFAALGELETKYVKPNKDK